MPILAQKKALVTGGSRGIGAGIVKALAEQGTDVGFTYKAREDAASKILDEVEALGRRAIAIKADSTKADRLTKAAVEAANFLGGLDIFVSSAGALLFKPIDEFALEDFDEIVSLDLRAAFVGSKAALPTCSRGAASSSYRVISPTMQPTDDRFLFDGQVGTGRTVQGNGPRPRAKRNNREFRSSWAD